MDSIEFILYLYTYYLFLETIVIKYLSVSTTEKENLQRTQTYVLNINGNALINFPAPQFSFNNLLVLFSFIWY